MLVGTWRDYLIIAQAERAGDDWTAWFEVQQNLDATGRRHKIIPRQSAGEHFLDRDDAERSAYRKGIAALHERAPMA